jgi:hypothetical protein
LWFTSVCVDSRYAWPSKRDIELDAFDVSSPHTTRRKFSAKRSSFNFEIASFSSYFCKAKEKKLPANFILALNIRAPYLLVAIAGIDLFPFGSGK